MIINVIGDITGYGLTLKRLVDKMPNGRLWCLGDIIDRGPNSKIAMDFLIDNKHKSVMGNHDHLMLFNKLMQKEQTSYIYPKDCWARNGGHATAKSLGEEYTSDINPNKKEFKKYFDFIEKMPLYKDYGNLILTHAPIYDFNRKELFNLKEINTNERKLNLSILWNRLNPTKIENKFQIYGHNSPKGILWHTKSNPYGIIKDEIPGDAWGVCIDTWRNGYLTGLSIDTKKLSNPKEAIKIYKEDIKEI